jgi:hypothetical protein
MLGKTSVLTLRGDLKKSYDCDQKAIEYAMTSCMPEPSTEVLVATQKLTNSEMEIPYQPHSQSRVKPNPSDVGIKAIQLQEGDPSKSVAEPPELFRLKCASHYHTGDINSTHFKRNNPLVCRVTARFDHGYTGSR